MLNKFFAKPIEVTVGEQSLKFSSLADFEFALAGRTSVPSKKITSMVKFSIDELRKEAKTIKEIEKQFVSMLSKSIEDPESINRALREMDAQIFSQDHGWRSIIAALHSGEEELNEFRRVALVKYMQYLSSRQEIIKYLYSEKKKHVKSSVSSNGEAGAEFKDTLMLENTVFEPLVEGNAAAEMEKMPKGENVTIRLKAGKKMDVLISKHPCKIISDESGCKFVDEAGRSYKLKIGKTVIGRDSKTDIMMDPNLRDVSRTHLVIEADDSNTLYLTDLSAHGTYIPRKYLESHTF
ncbi:MAG: FHA domain-containing protein [Proteobacteria bacterium]|nr:FHA domain-containing protein [Pseudomonadota bacterium]NOG61716.1 FHA domain-containing protein [Pseudomonadota bacterium]